MHTVHILPARLNSRLRNAARDIPETDHERHVPSIRQRTEAARVFACTDPEEFADWARIGRGTIGATVAAIRDSFCADCLPHYRARMESEGRCWRAGQPIAHDE